MASYDRNDKREAAQKWRRNGRNFAQLARHPAMPSRGTLYNWAKKGEPQSLTGGDDWFDWADREDAKDAEAARQQELKRAEKQDLSWAEAEKDRVRELAVEAHRQLTSAEGQSISASQYRELIELYLRLDNLSQEKIEWQQAQFTKMLTVLMEHVSEKQFAAIKADFMQLEHEARQDMPIPPADQRPEDEPVYRDMPHKPEGEEQQEFRVPAMPEEGLEEVVSESEE